MLSALLTTLLLAASIVSAAESPAPSPAAAQNRAPRSVLILQSFGTDFAPYNQVASHFRSDLASAWPEPIEFHEVPLETARYGDEVEERPFVDYLRALFAHRKLDLVVPLGGAAARFSKRYRAELFAQVPFLYTATDRRLIGAASLGAADAAVPVANDVPGQVEGILHLLPETEHLAIVLGRSPLERFWRAEIARELESFNGRLDIVWLDELSFEELRHRAAELPPRSAVLFLLLMVDGAGVPQESDRALSALAAVANAPIFGLYSSQMGTGIVGGRLISTDAIVDRAVEAASRLLRGEPPPQVRYPPLPPASLIFDRRQLERWRIPESRLPADSEVRFRAVSLWRLYRWPIAAGLALFALQSALIVGLLLQRRRRRAAEGEVHALHGRLLTTYEQERRRLARELHDDFTQRLARLAIDAAQVERPGSPAEGGATLTRMRVELVKLSDDVHTLSRQLHPSILDDLGLADALRSEGERFARDERIAVDLRLAETPSGLTPDAALCLFRVAQEALRNTAHHARASRVEIVLRRAAGELELGVRDDGIGFDPVGERKSPGLGHVSLRERLHLVGGRLEIVSAPGRGTHLVAHVPLAGGAA